MALCVFVCVRKRDRECRARQGVFLSSKGYIYSVHRNVICLV